MSKRELIDAILKHNRTAAPEFLAQFTESDLKAYLDRMAILNGMQANVRIQTTIHTNEQFVLS